MNTPMNAILIRRIAVALVMLPCTVVQGMAEVLPAAEPSVVRGADELYWVPTLEQALEMGKATGRPLFLMGYSLVPNGSTYTKLGADYCSGVF
jgi:hypothetical protein